MLNPSHFKYFHLINTTESHLKIERESIGEVEGISGEGLHLENQVIPELLDHDGDDDHRIC